MYCANCGKETRNEKFCAYCGFKTNNDRSMGERWFCPQCGVENINKTSVEGQRFCSRCGYEAWHAAPSNESPKTEYPSNATPQKWNLFSAYISMFKKASEFNTRSSRSEYWWAFLAHTIVTLILFTPIAILTTMAMNNNDYDSPVSTVASLFMAIYFLATLVPYIALAIRRLHDSGKSGWFLLLNLIPNLGSIIMMVFFVLDSQVGTNKYGANPKNVLQENNVTNASPNTQSNKLMDESTAVSDAFLKHQPSNYIEEIEITKEPDTIKCKKCGTAIDSNYKFCPNCKKRVHKQSAKKHIMLPIVISLFIVSTATSAAYAVTYYSMYKAETERYDNFIEEYNKLKKENSSLKGRMDLVVVQRDELSTQINSLKQKYEPESSKPKSGFNYIRNDYTSIPLRLSTGEILGAVTHDGYSAITRDELDSYVPKNKEEWKTIEKYKKHWDYPKTND